MHFRVVGGRLLRRFHRQVHRGVVKTPGYVREKIRKKSGIQLDGRGNKNTRQAMKTATVGDGRLKMRTKRELPKGPIWPIIWADGPM